jgi:hypothetical protein
LMVSLSFMNSPKSCTPTTVPLTTRPGLVQHSRNVVNKHVSQVRYYLF